MCAEDGTQLTVMRRPDYARRAHPPVTGRPAQDAGGITVCVVFATAAVIKQTRAGEPRAQSGSPIGQGRKGAGRLSHAPARSRTSRRLSGGPGG